MRRDATPRHAPASQPHAKAMEGFEAAFGRPPEAVAWAPGRGVDRVEVQVDNGPWLEVELGAVANDETWRTWRLGWDATEGEHRLRVRATDGVGAIQTSDEQPPAPDGATGWHTRTVSVI